MLWRAAAVISTNEDVTVVVPVFNERESIATLAEEADRAFERRSDLTHSVVFVDDDSTDTSWDEIVKVATSAAYGLRLRDHNCGFKAVQLLPIGILSELLLHSTS